MPLGDGANSFAPLDASRSHARAGRCSDPEAGLQRSVQTALGLGLALSAQYVTRMEVTLRRTAAARRSPKPSASAQIASPTSVRIAPG